MTNSIHTKILNSKWIVSNLQAQKQKASARKEILQSLKKVGRTILQEQENLNKLEYNSYVSYKKKNLLCYDFVSLNVM